MDDNKKNELLEKIQGIKHNFSKFVPTTIELVFDACLGILYEEFAAEITKLEAAKKGEAHLGFLRAKVQGDLQRNKKLVLHLRDRVTSIYAEVLNEPAENKKEDPGNGGRGPDSSSPESQGSA